MYLNSIQLHLSTNFLNWLKQEIQMNSTTCLPRLVLKSLQVTKMGFKTFDAKLYILLTFSMLISKNQVSESIFNCVKKRKPLDLLSSPAKHNAFSFFKGLIKQKTFKCLMSSYQKTKSVYSLFISHLK